MNNPIYLGVNVDHVATLRQARGVDYPDPVKAALIAEEAGADGITMHLREDRRHVQDHDIERFAAVTKTKLNFEMAATDEMRDIALRIKPKDVCLVPEKREELTTEGGLDVISNLAKLRDFCAAMTEAGIATSLFIDPQLKQIDAALEIGAPVIEIHTGHYAEQTDPDQADEVLDQIQSASEYACNLGLLVNAGHGLHHGNVKPIAAIPTINELNIGHSIVAQSVYMGFAEAVSSIKTLMLEARQ